MPDPLLVHPNSPEFYCMPPPVRPLSSSELNAQRDDLKRLKSENDSLIVANIALREDLKSQNRIILVLVALSFLLGIVAMVLWLGR